MSLISYGNMYTKIVKGGIKQVLPNQSTDSVSSRFDYCKKWKIQM